jgi:hypothetical protein
MIGQILNGAASGAGQLFGGQQGGGTKQAGGGIVELIQKLLAGGQGQQGGCPSCGAQGGQQCKAGCSCPSCKGGCSCGGRGCARCKGLGF